MKPLAKVATIASSLICVLLIIALVASYHSDKWRHAINITSSVVLGTADGWVSLGTDTRYISDHLDGVRLSYEGGEAIGRKDWRYGIRSYGVQQRTYVSEQGEFVAKDIGLILPGIYYRWFQRNNQPLVWTIMVSLWYPIIVSVACPAFLLLRRLRARGPNQRGAGNGAIRLLLHIARSRCAVPDRERWAQRES